MYDENEHIIHLMLQILGITVDVRRPAPGRHQFHEAVLETLANERNPLREPLGRGPVLAHLRAAKTFRNRWKTRTDTSMLYLLPDADDISVEFGVIQEAMSRALKVVAAEVKTKTYQDTIARLEQELADEKIRVADRNESLEWLKFQLKQAESKLARTETELEHARRPDVGQKEVSRLLDANDHNTNLISKLRGRIASLLHETFVLELENAGLRNQLYKPRSTRAA